MNISKIFFILNEYGRISKEQLYNCGANDKYIEGAIENDVLKAVGDYYVVGDVEALVEYGSIMADKGNDKAAASIFYCAYTKDYKNYNVNLQLLYRTVSLQKPKKGRIYKYFDVVYNKLVEEGKQYDANYYLFMIGNIYGFYNNDDENISDSFEMYREKFVNLEEDDILIPNKTKNSIENSVRRFIFANLYHDVEVCARMIFTDDRKDTNLEYLLERFLVAKWLDNKKFINMKLQEYLCQNKMNEAKNLLYKQEDRRSLTKTNEYILKIINSYLTIKDTGIIPKSKYDGDNTFDAIDGNNYELALELEKKRIKEKGIKKETYLYVSLKKIVGLIKPKEEVVQEVIKEEPIKQEEKIEPLPVVTLTPGEKQLLDDRVDKIYNGRMLFLLDPMPYEKRELVRDYLREKGCDDISAFSIGVEPERRIVLKYKPRVTEYVDLKATLEDARSFYASQNYQLAAEYYELSLKIGKPRETTYGGYGMTLYRLGRMKEAVDCLKIATIISKTEGNGKIDFTDIIERIECPVPYENRKPKVIVNESEFEDKKNSELDEKLINDIIGLMATGDISLNDACIKLGLSSEETDYIRITYARDCYYLEKYKEGDEYFKQVAKVKDKSERVKKIYKDILVNKNYYKNRLDSDKSQLVFVKK